MHHKLKNFKLITILKRILKQSAILTNKTYWSMVQQILPKENQSMESKFYTTKKEA